MADRYWVGGSGTWDASTTTNWSTTSGGAGGASAPTSADNVIIDANSGTGTITCATSFGSGTVCYDITVTATQAITLGGGTGQVCNVFGSLTYPATGSFVNNVNNAFYANDANTKTITTNGKALVGGPQLNGTGTFVLGSALSCVNLVFTGTPTLDVSASNYSITCNSFNNIGTNSNFTFVPRQGTVTVTGTTFQGGNKTYYNVAFTNTSSNYTITGANTFNNLSAPTRGFVALNAFIFSANQTINGTFSVQSGNTDPTKRVVIRSDTVGVQRTITAAVLDIQCCDFQDIVGAGAATWSDSTRSKYWGDCLNNSGITFAAGRTVYWNLAGSQNWPAIGWAATNNGTPNAQYFPLAQDTATFTEAGAAGTIAINGPFVIGSIQMADGVSNRTTAFTLNVSGSPSIYDNITLFSNLTLTGAGTITFLGQSRTQTITSAGVTWPQPITINAPNGTVKTQDALVASNTITINYGILDLNNTSLTCSNIGGGSNTNALPRGVSFGTGSIYVTGSGWGFLSGTNLSLTGSKNVYLTYSGTTGSRAIQSGGSATPNIYVVAGSDSIQPVGWFGTLDFTGFSGTLARAYSFGVAGDLVISSSMVIGSESTNITFGATSGTQKLTSSGKTLDFPIIKDGAGTLQLQDALTLGATRTFTHIAGTVDLNGKTLTVPVQYLTSNSNVRSINFGSGGIISLPGSGTAFNAVNATNLTTSGTGMIDMTSDSAKTFAGGGASYPTLNQGGSGALTVTGANTFQDITNTVSPATVIFPAGVTTTVTNLSLAGTASTDSTATIPSSLSRLTIGGSSINSGRELNGTIKRIAYYPKRVSNAELQGLTS